MLNLDRMTCVPAVEDLLTRVRSSLAARRDVEEKRMFGGTAFMVDGKMCVTVGKKGLMCRIDPALHDAAIERDGCSAMVMNGRVYRGYVRVDPAAVATKRDLDHWVGLALDFNVRAKSSRKKTRSR
jgi:TfoX/Sxy family transcriptional regulator of competence genes